MNKYLLTTSILSAALVAAPAVKAEESYVHGASVDMSTKVSKGRKLAELNYMHPFFAGENSLPIFDLKLKTDNYKSKEINAGLAYRHNLNDKAILGAYAYFDHRKTGNNFSVSGVTAGVELLSKYFDARANLYLPQNKRKKIVSNDTRAIEIKGNSIYAVSGGHTYESSFRGYDIEIGAPLFAFSDNLNEKFGTKVYAARYSFTAKGIKSIMGTRFRIAQDIFKSYVGKNSYNLYANAETQYDNVRKRQNFVGVGVKISFGDTQNKHKKKSGLGYRMMETIVRDVDIVTQAESEAPEIEDLYIGNNKIKRVLYVESGEHRTGDGTADRPYSVDHLADIDHDDAVVVEVNNPQAPLTRDQRNRLRNVLNGARTVLSTRGKNQMSIVVDGTVDANPTIVSQNNSVTHIKIDGVTTSTANGARRATLRRPTPMRRVAALVGAANAFGHIGGLRGARNVINGAMAANSAPDGGGNQPLRNALQLMTASNVANGESIRIYNEALAGTMTLQQAQVLIQAQLQVVQNIVAEGNGQVSQPRLNGVLERNVANVNNRLATLQNPGAFAAAQAARRAAQTQVVLTPEQIREAWIERFNRRVDSINNAFQETEDLAQEIFHKNKAMDYENARITGVITGVLHHDRDACQALIEDAATNMHQITREARVILDSLQGKVAAMIQSRDDAGHDLQALPGDIQPAQVNNLRANLTQAERNIHTAEQNVEGAQRQFNLIKTANEDLCILNISAERAAIVQEAVHARNAVRSVNRVMSEALIPDVDLGNLTMPELEAYITIAKVAAELPVSDEFNRYVRKQRLHDIVMGYVNSPAGNQLAVPVRIRLDSRFTEEEKIHFAEVARKIFAYKNRSHQHGVVHLQGADRQQGIGMDHQSTKDKTIVESLDRLRHGLPDGSFAGYGVLDGDAALRSIEQFIIQQIRLDLGNHALTKTDVENLVDRARGENSTQEYRNAVGVYTDPSATDQERSEAKVIIDDEVRSSVTMVNNSLAAYRSLDRLSRAGILFTDEPDAVPAFYIDEIKGKYSAHEMLAYTIVGNLDKNEVKRQLGGQATSREVFDVQQDNIKNLIKILGVGQRGYNMHQNMDIDEGSSVDIETCQHGYTHRLMDSIESIHSQVKLISITPELFGQEFQHKVKTGVQNLSEAERTAVRNWVNAGYQGNVSIVGNNTMFNGYFGMPTGLRNVLTDVTREMDAAYRFTAANKDDQLVLRDTAKRAFDYFTQINFN